MANKIINGIGIASRIEGGSGGDGVTSLNQLIGDVNILKGEGIELQKNVTNKTLTISCNLQPVSSLNTLKGNVDIATGDDIIGISADSANNKLIVTANCLKSLNELTGVATIIAGEGMNIVIDKPNHTITLSAVGGGSGVTTLNDLTGNIKIAVGEGLHLAKDTTNKILTLSLTGSGAGVASLNELTGEVDCIGGEGINIVKNLADNSLTFNANPTVTSLNTLKGNLFLQEGRGISIDVNPTTRLITISVDSELVGVAELNELQGRVWIEGDGATTVTTDPSTKRIVINTPRVFNNTVEFFGTNTFYGDPSAAVSTLVVPVDTNFPFIFKLSTHGGAAAMNCFTPVTYGEPNQASSYVRYTKVKTSTTQNPVVKVELTFSERMQLNHIDLEAPADFMTIYKNRRVLLPWRTFFQQQFGEEFNINVGSYVDFKVFGMTQEMGYLAYQDSPYDNYQTNFNLVFTGESQYASGQINNQIFTPFGYESAGDANPFAYIGFDNVWEDEKGWLPDAVGSYYFMTVKMTFFMEFSMVPFPSTKEIKAKLKAEDKLIR